MTRGNFDPQTRDGASSDQLGDFSGLHNKVVSQTHHTNYKSMVKEHYLLLL